MINLTKKSKINLSKEANTLSKIHFGVNWGMKESNSKGFLGSLFGSSSSKEAVDLDASITCFSGPHIDTVYFARRSNMFLQHSGDDLTGDEEKDDEDNETITANLDRAPNHLEEFYLYVNSYSGERFDEIPYASVRIYEGNVNNPTNVIASFNLSHDESFKGAKTIILGKVYRDDNNNWQFEAIGDTYSVHRIEPTVKIINNNYR